MDFGNFKTSIHFTYLLPFGSNNVLIDQLLYHLKFCRLWYNHQIKQYLSNIYSITDFNIIKRERGIILLRPIPMMLLEFPLVCALEL